MLDGREDISLNGREDILYVTWIEDNADLLITGRVSWLHNYYIPHRKRYDWAANPLASFATTQKQSDQDLLWKYPPAVERTRFLARPLDRAWSVSETSGILSCSVWSAVSSGEVPLFGEWELQHYPHESWYIEIGRIGSRSTKAPAEFFDEVHERKQISRGGIQHNILGFHGGVNNFSLEFTAPEDWISSQYDNVAGTAASIMRILRILVASKTNEVCVGVA